MDKLDLTAYAPVAYEVAGATGRVYKMRDWCPLTFANYLQSISKRESDLTRPQTMDEVEAAAEAEEALLGDCRKALLFLLHNAGEGCEDVTWDEVAADFPDRAPAQFLGFIYARWLRQQTARFAQHFQPSGEQGSEPTPMSSAGGNRASRRATAKRTG